MAWLDEAYEETKLEGNDGMGEVVEKEKVAQETACHRRKGPVLGPILDATDGSARTETTKETAKQAETQCGDEVQKKAERREGEQEAGAQRREGGGG